MLSKHGGMAIRRDIGVDRLGACTTSARSLTRTGAPPAVVFTVSWRRLFEVVRLRTHQRQHELMVLRVETGRVNGIGRADRVGEIEIVTPEACRRARLGMT